jgi:hypothetical protein
MPAQFERLDPTDARDECGSVAGPLLERRSEKVKPDLTGSLAEYRERGSCAGRAVL